MSYSSISQVSDKRVTDREAITLVEAPSLQVAGLTKTGTYLLIPNLLMVLIVHPSGIDARKSRWSALFRSVGEG